MWLRRAGRSRCECKPGAAAVPPVGQGSGDLEPDRRELATAPRVDDIRGDACANAPGEPQLLRTRNLPLNGAGVVDRVTTELRVFPIAKKDGTGLSLIALADGVSVDAVGARTEAASKAALGRMPAAAE